MQTKRKANWLLLSVICLTVGLPAFAASTPAELYQALRPCIDDQTYAVIHLDLTRFDVDALADYATGQMSKHAGPDVARHAEAGLQNFKKGAGARLNSLKEAGGRDIFAVFSMYDIPYFFLAVPIPPGANQAGLHKQVQNIGEDFNVGDLETHVSGQLIMFGLKRTVTRLKMITAAPSPVLEASLKACAGKTAKIMFFPSSDQRRILGEMTPQMPLESGKTQPMTAGEDLKWAALGLDGPPAISLNMTIQSHNAEGAGRMLTLVNGLYALAAQHPEARRLFPELDEILKRLTPIRQGDRLRLELSSADADSLINEIVAPSLVRVHSYATRLACGTNMSGLGKALLIYSNDYNDELPPDLETLIHKAEVRPKTLICPATGLRESYIYRGSGLTTSAIPLMITVYETAGNHGEEGRNVLFLDSHVEWVTEEQFQRYIEADNEYRREKGLPVLPAQ